MNKVAPVALTCLLMGSPLSAQGACEPNEEGLFSAACVLWTGSDGFRRGCFAAGGTMIGNLCQPASSLMSPGPLSAAIGFSGNVNGVQPIPLGSGATPGQGGSQNAQDWFEVFAEFQRQLEQSSPSPFNFDAIVAGSGESKTEVIFNYQAFDPDSTVNSTDLLEIFETNPLLESAIRSSQTYNLEDGVSGFILELKPDSVSPGQQIPLGMGTDGAQAETSR
ncbi:MAG: hypothetical protein AAFQ79_02415 [Pseudomonadota bacterium]